MTSGIAPLRGTTTIYSYTSNSLVLLIKNDHKYFFTKPEIFEDLYVKLDDVTAALKDDCIEYTVYYPDKPLVEYPDWFIEAYDNGYIFEEEPNSCFIFYDINGDMAMAPGSVILRNFMGELRYMEMNEFEKYYEIIGGN